jgi:hypothetical protein
VEQVDQRGMNGLYVTGQAQKTCKTNLSEWRRGDKRLAVVLHWFSISSADMANWGYYTTELEATEGSYEREKSGLLNGLSTMRYNPLLLRRPAPPSQTKGAGKLGRAQPTNAEQPAKLECP